MSLTAEQKIEKLKCAAAAGSALAVCDFDRTLTTPDSRSSMSALSKYYGTDSMFSKERSGLFERYSGAVAGRDVSELKKWWECQMSLLVKYSVPSEAFSDMLRDGYFTLRPGVREFFDRLSAMDVPIIVLSTGLGNVIETVFHRDSAAFESISIISNFVFYRDAVPVSYNADVFLWGKRAALERRMDISGKFILALGDNDEDMMIAGKNGVSLCFGESGYADICLGKNADFYDVMENLGI